MTGLRFSWDAEKEGLNRRKHGVSFEEAETAFYDAGTSGLLEIGR
jgi:hypothetical protein